MVSYARSHCHSDLWLCEVILETFHGSKHSRSSTDHLNARTTFLVALVTNKLSRTQVTDVLEVRIMFSTQLAAAFDDSSSFNDEKRVFHPIKLAPCPSEEESDSISESTGKEGSICLTNAPEHNGILDSSNPKDRTPSSDAGVPSHWSTPNVNIHQESHSFHSYQQQGTGAMTATKQATRVHHYTFLTGAGGRANVRSQELETTQLFSGPILDRSYKNTFRQYGLFGEQLPGDTAKLDLLDFNEVKKPVITDDRVFLNVSSPWSAFLCGSQGSGKSHAVASMLENCLIPSGLGELPHPLAAMVFHWDRFTSYGSNQICEAAYLCSAGIPVKVLVSPTNYWKMKQAYENLSGLPRTATKPKVIPLQFQEKHLDVSRMMNMMAVTDKDGPVPLYIEVTILHIIFSLY